MLKENKEKKKIILWIFVVAIVFVVVYMITKQSRRECIVAGLVTLIIFPALENVYRELEEKQQKNECYSAVHFWAYIIEYLSPLLWLIVAGMVAAFIDFPDGAWKEIIMDVDTMSNVVLLGPALTVVILFWMEMKKRYKCIKPLSLPK